VIPVEAEYKDGVLRPIKPLALRSGERVRLIVLRKPDPARWDLSRLTATSHEDDELAKAGLTDWADHLDSEDAG
jgi:predicted DNA-binding antitoxin AbrB/MazE fold protein